VFQHFDTFQLSHFIPTCQLCVLCLCIDFFIDGLYFVQLQLLWTRYQVRRRAQSSSYPVCIYCVQFHCKQNKQTIKRDREIERPHTSYTHRLSLSLSLSVSVSLVVSSLPCNKIRVGRSTSLESRCLRSSFCFYPFCFSLFLKRVSPASLLYIYLYLSHHG
jgi:hypothetical protein